MRKIKLKIRNLLQPQNRDLASALESGRGRPSNNHAGVTFGYCYYRRRRRRRTIFIAYIHHAMTLDHDAHFATANNENFGSH